MRFFGSIKKRYAPSDNQHQEVYSTSSAYLFVSWPKLYQKLTPRKIGSSFVLPLFFGFLSLHYLILRSEVVQAAASNARALATARESQTGKEARCKTLFLEIALLDETLSSHQINPTGLSGIKKDLVKKNAKVDPAHVVHDTMIDLYDALENATHISDAQRNAILEIARRVVVELRKVQAKSAEDVVPENAREAGVRGGALPQLEEMVPSSGPMPLSRALAHAVPALVLGEKKLTQQEIDEVKKLLRKAGWRNTAIRTLNWVVASDFITAVVSSLTSYLVLNRDPALMWKDLKHNLGMNTGTMLITGGVISYSALSGSGSRFGTKEHFLDKVPESSRKAASGEQEATPAFTGDSRTEVWKKRFKRFAPVILISSGTSMTASALSQLLQVGTLSGPLIVADGLFVALISFPKGMLAMHLILTKVVGSKHQWWKEQGVQIVSEGIGAALYTGMQVGLHKLLDDEMKKAKQVADPDEGDDEGDADNKEDIREAKAFDVAPVLIALPR